MAPISFERHAAAVVSPGWRGVMTVLALSVALGTLLVFLDTNAGLSYRDLVRDTNAIAGQPFYFGAYSNLGILLWALTGSIALFSWFVVRDRKSAQPFARPLLLGGLFMSLACIDDMFMLHENSYRIGISEHLILATYALMLLGFVTSTRSVLFQSEWPLLGAAVLALGLSTLADVFPYPFTGQILVEEATKLSGTAFLAYYLVSLALTAARLAYSGTHEATEG